MGPRLITAFLLSILISVSISTSASTSLPIVRIQLPWYLSVEWAGLIMAKEKKFDRKHGINLEIVDYEAGLDVVEEVVSGRVDMGTVDAANLIFNKAKGADVVAVWAQMQLSPVGICSLKEANIKNVQALKGKKFGIQQEYEYLLDIFLLKSGLSKSDVNITYIKGDPVLPLEQKKVDAAGCFDIYQAPMLRIRGHEPFVIRSDELNFDFYEQVLFVTGTTLAERAFVVRGAIGAIRDGWDYVFENVDNTVDLMTNKYILFEKGDLLKTKNDRVTHQLASLKLIRWYMTKGVGFKIGLMRKSRWARSIAILLDIKMIDNNIEPEKIFVSNFVE